MSRGSLPLSFILVVPFDLCVTPVSDVIRSTLLYFLDCDVVFFFCLVSCILLFSFCFVGVCRLCFVVSSVLHLRLFLWRFLVCVALLFSPLLVGLAQFLLVFFKSLY